MLVRNVLYTIVVELTARRINNNIFEANLLCLCYLITYENILKYLLSFVRYVLLQDDEKFHIIQEPSCLLSVEHLP